MTVAIINTSTVWTSWRSPTSPAMRPPFSTACGRQSLNSGPFDVSIGNQNSNYAFTNVKTTVSDALPPASIPRLVPALFRTGSLATSPSPRRPPTAPAIPSPIFNAAKRHGQLELHGGVQRRSNLTYESFHRQARVAGTPAIPCTLSGP